MRSPWQFSRTLWSKVKDKTLHGPTVRWQGQRQGQLDKDLRYEDKDKDLQIGPRGQGLSPRTTTLHTCSLVLLGVGIVVTISVPYVDNWLSLLYSDPRNRFLGDLGRFKNYVVVVDEDDDEIQWSHKLEWLYQCCSPRGKSLSLKILDDQFTSPCP